MPDVHCSPGAHGGFEPHSQAPAEEQLSAVTSQTVQAPAAGPQTGKTGAMTQALFEQQPVGHEFASHVHTVFTHSVPLPHAAAPPQVQAPALQPSADEPHELHVAPPVPHSLLVGDDTQVEPLQHPLGHVASVQAGHTPALQAPGAQSSHSPPAEPHALSALPGWQVLFAQQPVGHELASQTHCPPTHSWPVAQV